MTKSPRRTGPPPTRRSLLGRALAEKARRRSAASDPFFPNPVDDDEDIASAGDGLAMVEEIDPYDVAPEGRGDLRQESPAFLAILGRVLTTLGERVDTGSWLAPSAVTVLSAPPDLTGAVAAALTRLAPEGLRPIGAAFVLQLADGGSPRTARTRFAARIRRALGRRSPVLIVLSSLAELEPSLRAVLPPALPLAPLTAEILHDLLGIVFPGDSSAGDLPEGEALARLGEDELLMSLRAETAEAATAAIAARVLRCDTRATGPGLAAIEGYGEAEAMARRLVADLTRWQRGEIPWREMTRSVLFEGAPGTGKTFLARAIGAAAGVPFHAASLADWQACGHLGEMLGAMQKSFAAARATAPSILFVDEVDSVGSRWSRDAHAENYRRQVINAVLTEIDGTRDLEGVLLIGATNDAGAIDPAVTRPGRFDAIVRVPNPGPAAIRRILAHHLGEEITEEDRERLVPHAAGLTAAGIDGAIREARARAREAGHTFGIADLEAVLVQPFLVAQDLLWRIAVHEAGHLLVGLRLTRGVPVRVSAAPGAARVEWTWPTPPLTRTEIEAQLALMLAGRAAEEIIIGEASAGAGGGAESDLARATQLALQLELRTGLGASTLLWRQDPEAALNADPDLRARISAHLDAGLARARKVLRRELTPVIDFADVLLNLRIVEGAELQAALRRTGLVRPSSTGCDAGPPG